MHYVNTNYFCNNKYKTKQNSIKSVLQTFFKKNYHIRLHNILVLSPNIYKMHVLSRIVLAV